MLSLLFAVQPRNLALMVGVRDCDDFPFVLVSFCKQFAFQGREKRYIFSRSVASVHSRIAGLPWHAPGGSAEHPCLHPARCMVC